MTTSMPPLAVGALASLKIVEMGQPIAGTIRHQEGDFGADVIKSEALIAGDPLKNWRLFMEGTSGW